MIDGANERSHPEVMMIDDRLLEQAAVAGDIVEIDPNTWAIHGSIPVDGEVILAEFDRLENARAALTQLSSTDWWSGDSGRPQ